MSDINIEMTTPRDVISRYADKPETSLEKQWSKVDEKYKTAAKVAIVAVAVLALAAVTIGGLHLGGHMISHLSHTGAVGMTAVGSTLLAGGIGAILFHLHQQRQQKIEHESAEKAIELSTEKFADCDFAQLTSGNFVDAGMLKGSAKREKMVSYLSALREAAAKIVAYADKAEDETKAKAIVDAFVESTAQKGSKLEASATLVKANLRQAVAEAYILSRLNGLSVDFIDGGKALTVDHIQEAVAYAANVAGVENGGALLESVKAAMANRNNRSDFGKKVRAAAVKAQAHIKTLCDKATITAEHGKALAEAKTQLPELIKKQEAALKAFEAKKKEFQQLVTRAGAAVGNLSPLLVDDLFNPQQERIGAQHKAIVAMRAELRDMVINLQKTDRAIKKYHAVVNAGENLRTFAEQRYAEARAIAARGVAVLREFIPADVPGLEAAVPADEVLNADFPEAAANVQLAQHALSLIEGKDARGLIDRYNAHGINEVLLQIAEETRYKKVHGHYPLATDNRIRIFNFMEAALVDQANIQRAVDAGQQGLSHAVLEQVNALTDEARNVFNEALRTATTTDAEESINPANAASSRAGRAAHPVAWFNADSNRMGKPVVVGLNAVLGRTATAPAAEAVAPAAEATAPAA